MLFLAILGFIFQSSIAEIRNEQFLANCPMPLHDAIAGNFTFIDDINFTYDITYGDDPNNVTNTIITCVVTDPDIPTYSVGVIEKEYSGTLISNQLAQFGHFADTVSAHFERASHYLITGWLFMNAPAEVSGLAFFNYISGIIIGWFGIGLIIIARSGG